MKKFQVVNGEPGEFAQLNAALARTNTRSMFVQDNGLAGALRAPPRSSNGV